MTSIMPRPIEQIMWPVRGLTRALEGAEGKESIPKQSSQAFASFDYSVTKSGQSFATAVAQEIAWQDGRTFPWAIDAGPPAGPSVDVPVTIPRPVPEEPFFPPFDPVMSSVDSHIYNLAYSLDSERTRLHDALAKATVDGQIGKDEARALRPIVEALDISAQILESAIRVRADNKKDTRTPFEIFNTIKNSVNDPANDERRGSFGLLTSFGGPEADKFIAELKRSGVDQAKAQEVIELLYDTAASPFGDLVLNEAAANKFAERARELGVGDLDWSKAINAFKEEHPIVALYAVAIDDVLADPARNANPRELEAMLRAGEAAVGDLAVGFVRRGPVALAGAEMPEGSARAAAASVADRAQDVEKLNAALGKLRARIQELRA